MIGPSSLGLCKEKISRSEKRGRGGMEQGLHSGETEIRDTGTDQWTGSGL